MKKDNTVGSLSAWERLEIDPYILGLWGADGYLRTSSIGLTSIYPKLIQRFRDFLFKHFLIDRLHLRVYLPPKCTTFDTTLLKNNVRVCSIKKAKYPAYHVYINSRPFVRAFLEMFQRRYISLKNIPAYFAGRFDGDGSITIGHDKDCRIVYTTLREAKNDQLLLQQYDKSIHSSVYHYKDAHTYVLYIRKASIKKFIEAIQEFSSKINHELIAP